MVDAGQPVPAVLDADAPPDVRLVRRVAEGRLQEIAQAFGALGEHLVSVPVGQPHHPYDFLNVIIRYAFVEEIGHGVDKDHARRLPAQGLGQLLGHKPQVEALLVGMPWYSTEALGKGFRVAVTTARRYAGTTPNGVPRRVGPFDSRSVAHVTLPCRRNAPR